MTHIKRISAYCLLIELLLVTNAFAQSGWFPLTDAPVSIYLSDIYFINNDTGFVNGTSQGAMRTTDGGLSWKPMGFSGGRYKFYFNNKLGLCISSPILMTTDRGFTWTPRPDIPAADVDFPTEKIGYALASSSDTTRLSLGKSTDSGKTWIYRNILPPSPGITHVVGACCLAFRDENHGFVTESYMAWNGSGGADVGFYTSDGGYTWTNTSYSDEILYLKDSSWLTTYINGYILKLYADGNIDSTQVVSLNTIPKQSNCQPGGHLSKYDALNIAALGTPSGSPSRSIFRSIDGGETWYQQYCHATTNFP